MVLLVPSVTLASETLLSMKITPLVWVSGYASAELAGGRGGGAG